MAGERILLVEDDPMIVDALRYSLLKEGFEVLVASDGESGLRTALSERPDLILLDLMLPKMGGLEVCREVRKTSAVPILMVTARGEEMDRVVGLELGADDYIVKPYSTRELVARIRANLRRTALQEKALPVGRSVTLGSVVIDLDRREVSKAGVKVHLSFREFELLSALLAAGGAVVPREQLLDQVWGTDWIGAPRTMDVHVRWLREKLEDDPGHPRMILTARNVGYRLVTGGESL
jgi:two-component system response regulator VicR